VDIRLRPLRQDESLFPDEEQQPHQRIFILEAANSGEAVGHVFWAPRQAPGTTTGRAYLYDLFVAERFRGRGLGRRALELVEGDARSEGPPGIDLNVWGGNDVARGLYRSAGYDERAVFMSKELE
jgi:ribosomal protein S18 acetylase RimI-like enzyme